MASNPYVSQTVPASYNLSPPPDDGSQTSNNLVAWAKHIGKIGDPLKTFVQNVNSAVAAAFSKTINIDSNEANQMAGSLAFAISTLTIASGAVTATRSMHAVDTEASAAADDLDTINVGSVSDGCLLWLRLVNAARVVTLKNGTGNLVLGEDVVLSADYWVFLVRNGSNWNLATKGRRTGKLIQRAIATTNTRIAVGGTTIPFDNSIPQSGEGVEVLTVSITPLKSTTRLRINFIGNVGAAAVSPFTTALFQDAVADSLCATSDRVSANSTIQTAKLFYEMDSPGTSSVTFKIRIGPSGAVSMDLNGTGGADIFGGVSVASLTVDEIEP